MRDELEFFLKTKKYKISKCPICKEGIVQICKDATTNELYLMCDECNSEWMSVSGCTLNTLLPFDTHKSLIEPTFDEIVSKGFEKYLVKDKTSLPKLYSNHSN